LTYRYVFYIFVIGGYDDAHVAAAQELGMSVVSFNVDSQGTYH